MDDIISFSNCNPFENIWKLYTDNKHLASQFKIKRTQRQGCITNIPDCFEVGLPATVVSSEQY